MEEATGSETRTGSLCWKWGWQAIQKAGSNDDDLQLDKGGLVITFMELVPAKGLPWRAAVSPGQKGRRLGCRRSPGRSKRSERLRFRFPAPNPHLRRDGRCVLRRAGRNPRQGGHYVVLRNTVAQKPFPEELVKHR